ncbi:MAG: protein kinase family protein [Gammaproteobacteria bacterium]|nr:protein kinase family protein [Gammaproteobacteria bacterium]
MAATRKSKVTFGPFEIGHSRLIAPEGTTFELWSNLRTQANQKEVLKSLHLPAGVLPIGPNGRLVFGEGNFGRVRLARCNGQFLAVKKTKWEPGKEMEIQSTFREYCYGRELIKQNIPNVMAPLGILDAPSSKGGHKIYQFMPLATLGSGLQLKSLLKYLDGPERNRILIYTASIILSTFTQMQNTQMFHRDFKASNLLINNDGNIYVSDFGGGYIARPADFNANEEFQVSAMIDTLFCSPELHHLTMTNNPIYEQIDYMKGLDNWRVGLTLLELCGCIKAGQGILRSVRYLSDDEKQDLFGYFRNELQKIKNTSAHKIPPELYDTIFSLLEVDYPQRATAASALDTLALNTRLPERSEVTTTFRTLTKCKMPHAVIDAINKALKQELYVDRINEIAKQFPQGTGAYDQKSKEYLENYKHAKTRLNELLNDPNLQLHTLNGFVESTLKTRAVKVNKEQFNVLQALVRYQFLQKEKLLDVIQVQFTPHNIDSLRDSVAVINAATDVETMEKNSSRLLELSQTIKQLNYFATSYPYFYPTSKPFQQAIKKLNHLKKYFNNSIKKFLLHFSKEINSILQQIEHPETTKLSHFELLEQLRKTLHTAETFMPVFKHSEISSKKITKFEELMNQAYLQQTHLVEPLHRNEQFEDVLELKKHDGFRSSADPIVDPIETPVAVEGTSLVYLKSKERVHYHRTPDYLNTIKASEQVFARQHGYTPEEQKLVVKMVDDFMSTHKQRISIKGNQRLAKHAAMYLHHKDENLLIYVNGKRYPHGMISEFEKVLHSPHGSEEGRLESSPASLKRGDH